jgi:hypothetical protein
MENEKQIVLAGHVIEKYRGKCGEGFELEERYVEKYLATNIIEVPADYDEITILALSKDGIWLPFVSVLWKEIETLKLYRQPLLVNLQCAGHSSQAKETP